MLAWVFFLASGRGVQELFWSLEGGATFLDHRKMIISAPWEKILGEMQYVCNI